MLKNTRNREYIILSSVKLGSKLLTLWNVKLHYGMYCFWCSIPLQQKNWIIEFENVVNIAKKHFPFPV